jgi:hypothetical protein
MFSIPKSQAKMIFSGLKQNSWKQIYDAKWQKHGPLVFDKGLHGGHIEPGYYQSILNAHQFAEKHLCEPLTINFYRKLHQVACAHFKGAENSTHFESEKAGTFRTCEVSQTLFGLIELYNFYEKDSQKMHPRIFNEYSEIKTKPLVWYDNDDKKRIETLLNRGQIHIITYDNFQKIDKVVLKAFDDLSQYTEMSKQVFGAAAYPGIQIIKNNLCLCYPLKNLETSLEMIFNHFNQKISEIQQEAEDINDKDERKLRLIADLYQKLEWLHPFIDGQGRTDLILLSKLLSEHGFNPAILDEPYVSSYVPLADWCKYLREGMSKWIILKEQDN